MSPRWLPMAIVAAAAAGIVAAIWLFSAVAGPG